MKTITLGFSKSSKSFAPFSKLIMWVQQTPFSHVYIKIHSTNLDRDIIYQASHLAVNFMGSIRFLQEEIVYQEFILHVSDQSYNKTMKFAIDNSGVPYGILQVIGIGWVLLLQKFNKTVSNPFPNGNSNFVCSELIADILKECLGENIQFDADTVTPKEMYDFVSAMDLTKIV